VRGVAIRELQHALARLMELRTPLAGAPDYARPNAALRGLAHEYGGQDFPSRWAAVDPERGKRVAAAYDAMVHDPDDPLVAAAWRQMGDETLEQMGALLDRGYRFDFMPNGESPYRLPHDALADLRENKHLYVFPSEEGFGTINTGMSNPLLRPVRGMGRNAFGGGPFVQNDAFRAIHDALGHAPIGAGFRAEGEENAFRHHRAMFSDLALPALTAETRGQNSWVNFGPHGPANRNASPQDTIYADQKVGLMPEWVYNEGVEGRQISLAELRKRLAVLLAILAGGSLASEREAA
jgi:hypothetical protein